MCFSWSLLFQTSKSKLNVIITCCALNCVLSISYNVLLLYKDFFFIVQLYSYLCLHVDSLAFETCHTKISASLSIFVESWINEKRLNSIRLYLHYTKLIVLQFISKCLDISNCISFPFINVIFWFFYLPWNEL